MFICHLGTGLALKRVAPRLNLGWLFAAARLPDLVLSSLVLPGVERAKILALYAQLHCLRFYFPWPHSLLAVCGWSALVFALARLLRLDLRATTSSTRLGRFGLVGNLALLTACAFGGQLFAPAPPSANQLAMSSLVTLFIVFALASWPDHQRHARKR